MQSTGETDPTTTGLKDYFADDFTVGASLKEKDFREQDAENVALILREFNTVTPENDLKWSRINPARDTFKWDVADAYVKFGEKHDLWTIGHCLVWYLALPDYIKNETDPVTVRAIVEEHIQTVAGRYAGRIDGWDVLNEALEEDGTMRDWSIPRGLGDNWVSEVFKLAKAADPDAELYYNDYNLYKPSKRAGAVRMLKKALANGAPIDGIGMQCHYALDQPELAEIEASIKAFADLGLKVMITELDVSVLPNPWNQLSADPRLSFENTPYMNPYPDALPDSVAQAQAVRYADFFRLFRKHADKISRVTFWNVNDADTWLNYSPIKGRTNYPLLFDRNYRAKVAYDSVVAVPK